MIPVVDLRSGPYGDELLDVCRTLGFVSVVDHGVRRDLFTSIRDQLRRLFALDDAAKRRLTISRDDYRGFIPLGFFTPNRGAVSGRATDLYEGYKLHWECPPDHPVRADCALYGSNRWPDDVPELVPLIREYWSACDGVASVLLDAFADGLGTERTVFRSWHCTPLTNMTLLHYPPGLPDADTTGIHPHKDTNVITLLHPDPLGGLEVRSPDGDWVEVEAPGSALVVNVGEMLESWSGGEFVATPHRVVNRSGLDRYSFPYFVVPNHDVVVEPLQPRVEGYDAPPMPVGALSAEVWRTNWPDEIPLAAGHDLGALDR